MNIDLILDHLADSGNLRHIPDECDPSVVDLSSNDYLGLAERSDLRDEFFADKDPAALLMSASASRLLGARQREYTEFEAILSDAYGNGRSALAFNSGYHANIGLIQALADKHTLIIADRLVHASIIDGIKLSGAPFERFRHNDYDHLERIIDSKAQLYDNILIVAESVYSMDGDSADIDRLIEAKRRCGGKALLYIDEAHAVGVTGPAGLGLAAAAHSPAETDIIVGTMGKALASAGAYAIMSPKMRDFMVNKSRSLIFSTALPPINIAWSSFIFKRMLSMDSERQTLRQLAAKLADALGADDPSHIRPLIVGDARKAVELSMRLLDQGYKVLPIRTPTVPPGTERLRFSLSAAIAPEAIDNLAAVIGRLTGKVQQNCTK